MKTLRYKNPTRSYKILKVCFVLFYFLGKKKVVIKSCHGGHGHL